MVWSPFTRRRSKSEVALLTDTTGSMGSFINSIRTIFSTLSLNLRERVTKWAVAEYKDLTDGSPFSTDGIRINTTVFTADFAAVQTAINGWSASGGGDEPEEQFLALKYLGERWNSTLEGTGDQSKIIIWGGDASAHSAGSYPTRAQVITALEAATKLKVFALNLKPAGQGIDTNGDATAIAAATGGQVFQNVSPGDTAAILAAIAAALG